MCSVRLGNVCRSFCFACRRVVVVVVVGGTHRTVWRSFEDQCRVSSLGSSLMAPGAVNYLIGAEEDWIIDEGMEGRDLIIHRQGVRGMVCCEGKAVRGGDQQVRLMEETGSMIWCSLLSYILSSGISHCFVRVHSKLSHLIIYLGFLTNNSKWKQIRFNVVSVIPLEWGQSQFWGKAPDFE